MSEWSLYILRCSDNSLYTGIATDVTRRIGEHQGGKLGARYLRGRAPYSLVFRQTVGDRSAASRAELHVKRLSKQEKERLIRSPDRFRRHIRLFADP